ncbi:MAG: guanylate kinase [Bacillota bacterium]|jgi:guanylate kinase|nr:guanylate kinase [Bacillota bacterium]NLV61818.1 guanylate kinase [Clostridiaceae bacterium]
MKSGLLVVVSGPAGVGKGTVVSRARKKNKNIVYSVSATSRKPRPGEKDGTNYYFVSRERFKEMIRKQELVEWVEYCGNFYGTPRAYVEEQLKKGRIVLLEIEVKGASNIKKQYPECVSIFIAPPDLDELKKRITNRGTEPPDVIEERMRRAEKEMEHISEYDYVVINDTVDNSSNRLLEILEIELEAANKRMCESQ